MRFGFGLVRKDIHLLNSALAFNPWKWGLRSAEKWAEVAQELKEKFDYTLTGRTARGRVYLLLKKLGDKQNDKKITGTGTFEEKTERLRLLGAARKLMEAGTSDSELSESEEENMTELIFNNGEIVNVISNGQNQMPIPSTSAAERSQYAQTQQAPVAKDPLRFSIPIPNEPTTSELSAEISALHKRVNQLEKTLKLMDDKVQGKIDLILDFLGNSRKEQMRAHETMQKNEDESFQQLRHKCKGKTVDSTSSGIGRIVIPVLLAVSRTSNTPQSHKNTQASVDPLSLGTSSQNTAPGFTRTSETSEVVRLSSKAADTHHSLEPPHFDLDDVKLEPFENEESELANFENYNVKAGSIEISVGSAATRSLRPGQSHAKNFANKILTNRGLPRILQKRRRRFLQTSTALPSKYYHCPICSKKYMIFKNLRVHLKDHSGQEHPPFNCQSCHTRFRDPLSMAKHVRFKNCGIYI